MYAAVDPKAHFPDMEERVLAFWRRNDIFERSVQQRASGGTGDYLFYDGPPFATGLPHFGHFVPGTIKDIFPRYHAMRGKRVERRFGWDCHGLPVEHEMEKELGISGRAQIEEYGVARFNEACRSIVLRYTAEWRTMVERMGRWVDVDNDYRTMDVEYMESIWWVFKQLWNKQLIYESYYILPYSPGLATPLSNFEVNLGGYRQVNDPAITVGFKLRADGRSQRLGLPADTQFLAWTTTPWTLPANLGLAVGPQIEYALVHEGGRHYLLAAERVGLYWPSVKDYRVIKRLTGHKLAGLSYEPPFPYFADLRPKGAFRTHAAEYVTTDEGSGIVHVAPGFGEDDFRIFKDSDLPIVVPIDDDCRFLPPVDDFVGLFVKDADRPIIEYLKRNGLLIKRENWLHPYPFCYRTDKPLIYRAIGSWFVNIQKIKPDMIAANAQVAWIPSHLRDGRFGKWLQDARDWAISRNRYWGNPIPIWKCDGSDYVECIGSRAELEQKSGRTITDLHKHCIDDLTWPSPDGRGTMRRTPEVLDCWFESGAMPYAQYHYPFENRDRFEHLFPADFICEGLDQTRGWFYTLTVLAAALRNGPAFRTVVVNGLVLAEDGQKMSKRARNYTPPQKIIDKFGADALRLYLMKSPVTRAEDLSYSDEGVATVLKTLIIPLWNSYAFFVTYANIDNVQPDGPPDDPTNPLDRWILSESERLTEEVGRFMEAYDLPHAIDVIAHHIDGLNNWYIRRSRRRFWRSENDSDKIKAYCTLYATLLRLITVAAPIIPFICEEIYRNLRSDAMPESIHLCDWPTAQETRRDTELEQGMELCRTVVSMGHAIRRMHEIKIRQPLLSLQVVTSVPFEHAVLREMETLIIEELNIKEIRYHENEEELVDLSAKPNYPRLGSRLGADMKALATHIARLSAAEVHQLMSGGTLAIELGERVIELTNADIVVQRHEKSGMRVQNRGSLTVGLDVRIRPELRNEGWARDIVRVVQNMRKESGLAVTDRIRLCIAASHEIIAAIEQNRDYLNGETLTTELTTADNTRTCANFPIHAELQLNSEICRIGLCKAE